MTELMLRLIKDGKIVGYEWHIDGLIQHTEQGDWFNRSGSPDDILYSAEYSMITGIISHPEYIKHDSFDLGIKVGDEWYFTRDILRITTEYSEYDTEITMNNGCHIFDYKTDDYDTWLFGIINEVGGLGEGIYSWKRIGTIYDEVSDE